MTVAVWVYLTDRPADAHWLAPDERQWLSDRLAAEQRVRESHLKLDVLRSLLNPRVLAFGLVYLGIVTPHYGISFFLPQIINAFGQLTSFEAGLINAFPYAVGAMSMALWCRLSDAVQE